MISLTENFELFRKKNILVIGDIMVDSYMWGKVQRISPEAPIPIIAVSKKESRLGGAANVALNIKSLDANPIICSFAGNDEYGKLLLELLEKRGISSEGIILSEKRKTTVKTRMISDGQHLLRVDEEIDTPIDEELEKELLSTIQTILSHQNIDAIVFEDYDKGVITPKIIKTIVALANDKNIPTLVDPKKRNFLEYKDVTLFKPNLKELAEGLKEDICKNNIESIKNAAEKIHHEKNVDIVMVTLSERGIFISDRKSSVVIPAEIRDISDVSGAGDTVISVATLCVASGFTTDLIARISNVAGGLVCEKVGVVPIDKDELIKECLKRI